MRLFRRTPKPPVVPTIELPGGETADRNTRATLIQGKQALKGALLLTPTRLLFEADRGDARWLSVPFAEVKASGIYPAPQGTIGRPLSTRQKCLFIETTSGEHVWYAFDQKAQAEWLALVQARAREAAAENAET
jgi:hypothetical protein